VSNGTLWVKDGILYVKMGAVLHGPATNIIPTFAAQTTTGTIFHLLKRLSEDVRLAGLFGLK